MRRVLIITSILFSIGANANDMIGNCEVVNLSTASKEDIARVKKLVKNGKCGGFQIDVNSGKNKSKTLKNNPSLDIAPIGKKPTAIVYQLDLSKG